MGEERTEGREEEEQKGEDMASAPTRRFYKTSQVRAKQIVEAGAARWDPAGRRAPAALKGRARLTGERGPGRSLYIVTLAYL